MYVTPGGVIRDFDEIPIWAVGLHGAHEVRGTSALRRPERSGEVACLASRKYRWVRFPHGPLRHG